MSNLVKKQEIVMQSILTGKQTTETQVKEEADVIVTATILGFIGTRYHLCQPCSFDIEYPNPEDLKKWKREAENKNKKLVEHEKYLEYIQDHQLFLRVLSAMSIVLNETDQNIGRHLDDSQSPKWEPGALITGLPGGANVDFSKRHRDIKSSAAKNLAGYIEIGPALLSGSVYQGRGAYTGMIDDPITNKYLIRPTRRVIDRNPKRWHPGSGHRNSHRWGLISPEKAQDVNLNEDRTIGMGGLPANSDLKNERIGYIHGMSSAICECIKHGPWCTPFEMATGTETTKMASCFACCTYMYAAGYPPSSMHLGRSESWVPPDMQHQIDGENIPSKKNDKKDMDLLGEHAFKGLQNEFDQQITSSVLIRWHREVYGYMTLGVQYLLKANTWVNPASYEHVKQLKNLLDKSNNLISEQGGNLFLDALTVHESDWKRIQNTLLPAYKHVTTLTTI